jgi:hypothetical protein
MSSLRSWLQHRRETIRKAQWLPSMMMLVDLVFVFIGIYVSSPIGVAISFFGILFNELLSPLIVRHLFHKELHSTVKGTASLEIKVIRAERAEGEAAQPGAEADNPPSGGPAA